METREQNIYTLLNIFERFGKQDAQAAVDFVRKNLGETKITETSQLLEKEGNILPNGVYV